MKETLLRSIILIGALGEMLNEIGVDIKEILTDDEYTRLDAFVTAIPDPDDAAHDANLEVLKTLLREVADEFFAEVTLSAAETEI